MLRSIRSFVLGALLAGLLLAHAQQNISVPQAVGPLQPGTTLNTETISGNNAAQTKSISGATGKRVYLYSVTCRCSSTTGSQLTVKDGVGGTVIWSSASSLGCISTSATTGGFYPFVVPLASSVGNGMDIVAGSCGASNTSTLDAQASQF